MPALDSSSLRWENKHFIKQVITSKNKCKTFIDIIDIIDYATDLMLAFGFLLPLAKMRSLARKDHLTKVDNTMRVALAKVFFVATCQKQTQV